MRNDTTAHLQAHFRHVLEIINMADDDREAKRYEPERSEVRTFLDRIIAYSNAVEAALAVKDRKAAIEIAGTGLFNIFDGSDHSKPPNEFKVTVLPRHDDERFDRLKQAYQSGKMPTAEDLFRVNRLVILPLGEKTYRPDVAAQFRWTFFQVIVHLEDFRYLRKCSGELHEGPHYFIGVRLQKPGQHHFCSSQCRSDYNYKLKIKKESKETQAYGRQRSIKKR